MSGKRDERGRTDTREEPPGAEANSRAPSFVPGPTSTPAGFLKDRKSFQNILSPKKRVWMSPPHTSVSLFFTLSVQLDWRSAVNCSLHAASNLEAQGQVVLALRLVHRLLQPHGAKLLLKSKKLSRHFFQSWLDAGRGDSSSFPR